MIFKCATDNLASPIVGHCQTLSLKKQWGLIILYLTTIVTMIDNIIIVNAIGDIASPIVDHCQTLSFKKNYALICRSNNKGLCTFVLNDNSDND